MSEWYPAADLAGLPGMPGTKQAVLHRARTNTWQSRPRRGRGGGREYHLSSLPPETRRHLAAQHAKALAPKLPTEPPTLDKAELLAKFQQFPKAKQEGANARAEMLRIWRAWLHTTGQKKRTGTELFCRDFSSGRLRYPDWITPHMPHRKGVLGLNYATLNRWENREKQQGIYGLVDGYGTRAGQTSINAHPKLRKIIEALIIERPHITGRKIKEFLNSDYPALNIVSAKAIDRHMEKWTAEHAQDYRYQTDPDGWKNTHMAAFGSRSEGIERLNQVWELDATPADWMLVDGRHSVSGNIDVYSRRLRLLVTRTPRAEAHCTLLRRSILDWGKPELIRHDQGQDYVAKRMVRVCEDLLIDRHGCRPFTPEDKPHIERSFRTMAHGILDQLPGFIGHNVAERTIIEARKSFSARLMTPGENIDVELTAEQLQQRLDDWIEHVYDHNPHSGLDGATPADTARGYPGKVARIANERALDLLLQDSGTRTVGKKGIRIDGGLYIAAELSEWIGEEVEILRDPDDIGRIHVYGYAPEATEKAFICLAQDPDRTGISRTEVAVVAKKRQRKARQAAAKAHRAASRDLKNVDIAKAVIEHRKEQRRNVTELPNRSTEYTNNALDQAARAAAAADGYHPAEPNEATKAAKARLAADMRAPVAKLPEKPAARYRRWLQLDRALQAGGGIDNDEHAWWKSYRQSTEFKTQKMMFDDFADTYRMNREVEA